MNSPANSSSLGSRDFLKGAGIAAVAPGVIAISMHCGHWEYGRYASGKKFNDGADDDGHWWTSHGTHPNGIIPNSPGPIRGQQRFMDTVVTVSRAVAV